MGSVFRQYYPHPIPEGAKCGTITKNGKRIAVVQVNIKGRKKAVTARIITKGKHAGTHCRVPSPYWYGKVRGNRVKLKKDKFSSEQLLADKLKKADRGEAGLVDPFEKHNNRPLAEHLADYRRELEAKENAPKYVNLVASRLQALFDGCGFAHIPDLSASKTADWLAGLRRAERERIALPPGKEEFTRKEAAELLGVKPTAFRDTVAQYRLAATGKGPARRFPRATVQAVEERQRRGVSVQTTNYYLSHLKSFCTWLVEDGRAAENKVARLEAGNVELDRRHDRRELTADELRRVLAAARVSEKTFRGLDGWDRFHLYATACGTGFRAAGLASLAPTSFELDSDRPIATLPARRNKSRKTKVQPLPPDVAELLRGYLAGKPRDARLWPGPWAEIAAEMLRIDLEAAGIPYTVEGPDGPLHADFHALRHSYLTLGGRAGIDLRTLQELAGHSTPVLTARYSHVRLHDLSGAVEKMPSFLPLAPNDDASQKEARATGTEGPAPPRSQFPCPVLVQKGDIGCDSVTSVENSAPLAPHLPGGPKLPARQDLSVVDNRCESLKQEAPPGFEPGIADLQSTLNHCSISRRERNLRMQLLFPKRLAAVSGFGTFTEFRLTHRRKEVHSCEFTKIYQFASAKVVDG